jgi:hypothetical protein
MVTSASVTTPFLNRRSSSSSDEHLGLVKEKLLGFVTHPAVGCPCSQRERQGLGLMESRVGIAGAQGIEGEGRAEILRTPDGTHP